MRHLVWFSCGAASAVTAMLVLKENVDAELVYCDTGGEHPDNVRFLADIEARLNRRVTILKSEKYADHFDVIEKTKYINGPHGARCTVELKKRLRFAFQQADDVQYFGYTIDEKHRAARFCESYPEVDARFPLIETGLTKEECIGMLWKAGIQLPAMYRLGFNNNNCIGCVKGGAGYWNKIRKHFPEQFNRMAEIERRVGATCLSGQWLDELDPRTGHHKDTVITCDFVCAGMEAER